ncbi:MAG: DnaJ domain-containing protein [Clostridia bacterium]|nr:DnaJ domain-containing protein [Clostridia bacterium]
MNPYEILGVNPSDSDETIKKAYRELVKKYHPDKYKDNPLEDLAKEKLQEINQAYDKITKERSGKRSGRSNYSGGSNYSGYSGSAGSSTFANVRNLIRMHRFRDAEAELNRLKDDSAEWHFLTGVIYLNKGWHFEGIQHIQTAVDMEPDNMEYRNILNNVSRRQQTYQQTGNTYGYGGGMSSCDCCSNLLCADCCCEMFGGDLISCC